MKILVSGATGLIGSALVAHLRNSGHEVAALVRTRPARGSQNIYWSPEDAIDASEISRFDAVVHLAGRNIAAARWSSEQARLVRESRVIGTRNIAAAIERSRRAGKGPSTLINASAIGYYGDRGDEELTETSPPGRGYLSDVSQEWEASTRAASDAGARVVLLRIGLVLDARGGALPKMLTPFKLGLGGKMGGGHQYWSWITLYDLVAAIDFALNDDSLSGPVNLVSPSPLTNTEFTQALGAALHRPTLFPVPKFAARLIMGSIADDIIFASQRVFPRKLEQAGFKFHYPELTTALQAVLAK